MSVRTAVVAFAMMLPLSAPSSVLAKGKRKGALPADPNNPAMRTLLGAPRPDHRLGLAPGLESVWPGKPVGDVQLPEVFSRVDMYSAQHSQLTYEGIMTPLKFAPDRVDHDKIGAVQIAFPTVENGLAAYFGRGRTAKGTTNAWSLWVDPTQRIRALAADSVVSEGDKRYAMTTVHFESYWSVETLLSEIFVASGAQGPIEVGPTLHALLGAKAGGARDSKDDSQTVEIPATEFNWSGQATIRQRDQRIESAQYTFNTLADPEGVKAFVTKLCAFLPKVGMPCKARAILKKHEFHLPESAFGGIHVRIGAGSLRITRGLGDSASAE